MILCACCLGYKLALITHTSPFSFPLKWKLESSQGRRRIVLPPRHHGNVNLRRNYIYFSQNYDLNIEHR
jgi:hypothetical protein